MTLAIARDGAVLRAAELQAAVQEAGLHFDKIVAFHDCGSCNAAITIVRMEEAVQGFFLHDVVTEIYYVIEGSGLHHCGGTLIDPQTVSFAPTGPSAFSSEVDGGEANWVGKGDVVVVPAATPHSWKEVREALTYFVVRIDPTGVLAIGSYDAKLR